jgi:AP-3 complex subunit delta-1
MPAYMRASMAGVKMARPEIKGESDSSEEEDEEDRMNARGAKKSALYAPKNAASALHAGLGGYDPLKPLGRGEEMPSVEAYPTFDPYANEGGPDGNNAFAAPRREGDRDRARRDKKARKERREENREEAKRRHAEKKKAASGEKKAEKKKAEKGDKGEKKPKKKSSSEKPKAEKAAEAPAPKAEKEKKAKKPKDAEGTKKAKKLSKKVAGVTLGDA